MTGKQYGLDDGVGRLQDGAEDLFENIDLKGRTGGVCSKLCGVGTDSVDTMRDLTVDQPLFAVMMAGLIGLLVGAFIARR